VTVIETASRPDQRILESTLATLPDDLATAQMAGPALTFYGLAPREALNATLPLQERA
jgi:siroheme synthase